MAIELTEAIDESLRENKLIQVVDHIESASAAEEAIFLAMGLTRNSGGRDFSPESDVTLEMSIDERDASGKIFANATLDIRTTLEVTGEAPQVATQSNRVGEFNSKLVPGVRSEILAGLRAIESGKKTSAAAKPGARRAQADRELDLIKMIDRKLPQFERTTLKFNLAHSALKLDPTYWRAALSVATANAGVYREDETRTDRHRLVLEAMKIVTDRAGDASLDQEAINSFNLTASNLLTILVDSEKAQRRIDSLKAAKKARPSRKISISEQQLSDAKLSEMVDTNLKRKICMAASLYLEQELKSPLIDMRTSFRFSKRSLQNAILGLKQTGSSPDELRPQIKRMIASLERLQSEHDEFIAGPSELDFHRRRQQNEYGYRVINEVRTSLMGVVCECQLTEEYDRLLPQLKKDLMRGKPIPWMIELQRKAIEPLGDPKRMASLESWIKDQGMEYGKKPTVRKTKTRDLQLAVIQFPKINVFANSRSRIVPAEDFEIDLPETHQIIPLTHTSNRLFFLASDALRLGWKSLTIIDRNAFSSRMKFGYIPISKDGNATGPAKFFELPSELQGQVIHGCVANENSLVLGTQANFRDKNIAGLYYLDISKNKWKYFGVEEGLPCQWITSIKSISNDRAICTGSMRPEIRQGERYSTYSRDSTFSFDLRTQKIRQLGLEAPNERGRVPGKLYCVYENRGIVYGQSQFFLWGDLLSSHPQKLLLKPQSKLDKLQYANVQDSVRMQDSLFFANSRGLHQMGLDGKDRRSWKSTSAYNNISPLTRIDFKPTQNAPPQSPLPWFPNLIATDDLLLMVDGMGMQMVGYDPKKEMWYGPIDVPKIIHGISGGSHIWVGGKSLRRMAVADIVTAAKQSDRVMTVKQFAERQQKLISSMTGLGRAKIEFSMLRFEESKTFLEKILERTPDDVETHLMLGILHDTWGLNDLEKASKSYQRAEELSKENRSMGLAAAKLHLDLLKRHEKFDRATKIAEKLLKDYPDTSNLFRQRIQDDGSRKR